MASGDMAPKTVGLIGAACLSAGWLVASLLTPPVARLQSLPERRGETARRDDAAPEVTTPLLQWQALKPVAPRVTRRNPFVFGGRESPNATSAPSGSTDDPGVVPPLPSAPRVVAPPFTLSGIAVTGEVRTAVLSDGSTVHLVTAGQTIGAFTVTTVADDSVTLADAAGERFVIRLR